MISVMQLTIRPYQESDEEQVIALWQQCNLIVSWNDPKHDIALKLQVQPELFLVGVADDCVAATIMAGYEGHRGWLNYLAVTPEFQRQGMGRQMVQEAEARLRQLGCPKINLQIRSSNKAVIEFYEHLGFKIDDVVSMGKRL
jgi:ribosomal protein S18 acetylase RimI-like enzyme